MIKYRLICKNCDFSFDSWFASSKEYEKLKRKKLLTCHTCHSKKIEKNIMAPKILKKNDLVVKNEKTNFINKKLKEYQNFIKKNFEYVGENFAYEARSIHYNEKKNKKGIYGKATNEEILELKNEGIDTQVIPWVEDKKN
tara:strand:- start:726 stop:1145 length:420 start_codon:yes stop_codon:yes gene_type:complete